MFTFSLEITEELEKVKQEMEEKGNSMTDGGKFILAVLPEADFPSSELVSNSLASGQGQDSSAEEQNQNIYLRHSGIQYSVSVWNPQQCPRLQQQSL